MNSLTVGVGTWTNRKTGAKVTGALVCDKPASKDARLWDEGTKHFFVVDSSLKLTTLYSRAKKIVDSSLTVGEARGKFLVAGFTVTPIN